MDHSTERLWVLTPAPVGLLNSHHGAVSTREIGR
jgi:hypothetical protein